ncbi:MAG: glutamine synthetase, partial [Planctomycetota bacterium]
EDLADVVTDRGIRIVSLMHVGGDGWLKTLDFVPRSRAHLLDVIRAGERADGSSLFKGMGIRTGASDIVLRPRPGTAFLDPFSPHETLAILCSHTGREGNPLPESPDTIVRRAHARLRDELGVDLWALGEVEYFLGKRATESDIYGQSERGYHATSPFVFGERLRREAMALLAGLGVHFRYGHSEVGYVEPEAPDNLIWEQHEVELALAPLPEAADGIALTQWVLRNLAHRYGMRLSFRPILRVGHAGSGLHFHMSPVVDGEPRGGRDDDGEFHDAAKWLIGGLVRLGGALMAFGNREDGSFTRLRQGKEAPTAVTWGEFDRRGLVRLPVVPMDAEGKPVSTPTIEFRLPDGSAHPHLLLAGVAQAMVLGSRTDGLDALLAASNASAAKVQPGGAAAVPNSRAEVSEAVAALRDVFEAGDVFPGVLMDRVLAER